MRCIGDGDWVWYKMNKPSHSVWETETLSLGRARPYTGVNLQALQLLNKAVLENLENIRKKRRTQCSLFVSSEHGRDKRFISDKLSSTTLEGAIPSGIRRESQLSQDRGKGNRTVFRFQSFEGSPSLALTQRSGDCDS